MTKDEALKLALEALETGKNHGVAIDVLRRALAEQPAPPPECQTEAEKTAFAFGWWKALEQKRKADSALDRMAENARELGLDYEPIIERVENSVGMGHKAWDMVEPKELAKAFHEALAEQPALEQEIEELTAQRDKLADILTRTANALKGQPAELSLHSWHDLPEVAQQLKAAQQQEPVAVVSGYYGGQCVILPTNPARIFNSGTALYTSPPASKPCKGIAAAAKAEEREACAKVCEEEGLLWGQRYAAAIRARKELT